MECAKLWASASTCLTLLNIPHSPERHLCFQGEEKHPGAPKSMTEGAEAGRRRAGAGLAGRCQRQGWAFTLRTARSHGCLEGTDHSWDPSLKRLQTLGREQLVPYYKLRGQRTLYGLLSFFPFSPPHPCVQTSQHPIPNSGLQKEILPNSSLRCLTSGWAHGQRPCPRRGTLPTSLDEVPQPLEEATFSLGRDPPQQPTQRPRPGLSR